MRYASISPPTRPFARMMVPATVDCHFETSPPAHCFKWAARTLLAALREICAGMAGRPDYDWRLAHLCYAYGSRRAVDVDDAVDTHSR